MKAPKQRNGGAKAKRTAPASVRAKAAHQSPIDFLEGQLGELREALREAFQDGSWQAYSTLKRQEREVFDRLHELREAAKTKTEGPKLTDEQILRQRILPVVHRLPLPLAWELYRDLAMRLGQPVPGEEAAG